MFLFSKYSFNKTYSSIFCNKQHYNSEDIWLTEHFSHANENSGQSNELFSILAHSQRETNAGTVYAAEERQLHTWNIT